MPLFRQFLLNPTLYYSNQPAPIKELDILIIDIGDGHHEHEHSDNEVNDHEDLRAFDDFRAYEARADDEGAFYVRYRGFDVDISDQEDDRFDPDSEDNELQRVVNGPARSKGNASAAPIDLCSMSNDDDA